MHSNGELLLIKSSSSSSCEDVWEGEGEEIIRVPPKKFKRHCKKAIRQERNCGKERQDLEDELDKERRLVLDLDRKLLEMETENVGLLHQVKAAKRMAASLESHLLFLEEQVSNQSPAKQLLPFDKEAQKQDVLAVKHDLCHENQTIKVSKPRQAIKCAEMETQTEPSETEPKKYKSQHALTLVDEYITDKTETEKCGTKQVLRIGTKELCLQIIFQEFLVHLVVF